MPRSVRCSGRRAPTPRNAGTRAPQPHHIGGLPETVEPRVEELGSGAVIVDGELALQRGGGRRITLPGGGFGEIEFSAHRGPVISVT